jgi:hypothetical protein
VAERERKSLQVLKPHTQPPFYVDSRHYQPILYQQPQRIAVIERPPPPPQWAPTAFAQHPSIENFRAQPLPPPLPEPYLPQNPILESSRKDPPLIPS